MNPSRNWVAKNDFNRASVEPDRKKESKRGKRKDKKLRKEDFR